MYCAGSIRNRPHQPFLSFSSSLFTPLPTSTNSPRVMPNKLNLPTTVGELYEFLDGGFVAAYGDTGTTVIHALRTAIQLSIYNALESALRERSPGVPIDEVPFLREVFRTLRFTFPSTIPSILGPIGSENSAAIVDACYAWAYNFARTHITPSGNDNSGLLSESQVWRLLKNLLQDCDKGKVPTTQRDFRFIEISQALLTCLRQYLAELKVDEEDEEIAREISGSHSSESLTSVVGMNWQDGVDGDLVPSRQWRDAWNQPFRGRALVALENKLLLNAHAIKSDRNKEQMSRIIPVVQSSGTGKSRLAEEYVPFLAVIIDRIQVCEEELRCDAQFEERLELSSSRMS